MIRQYTVATLSFHETRKNAKEIPALYMRSTHIICFPSTNIDTKETYRPYRLELQVPQLPVCMGSSAHPGTHVTEIRRNAESGSKTIYIRALWPVKVVAIKEVQSACLMFCQYHCNVFH